MEDRAGCLEVCRADGKHTDVVNATRHKIQNFHRGFRSLRLAHCRSVSTFSGKIRSIRCCSTFSIIHLDNVLVYRIVKLWLLPSKTNLSGRDLFKGHLRRRGDIKTQFFHQDIIRSLANLPRTVKKPLHN